MKHCEPNHLLAHEDGVLLAILLIILNQLTKYEASIYNIFLDFPFTSFQWLNLQRTLTQNNKIVWVFFPKISPGNLLIILYQLTKFEAFTCSYNRFQGILKQVFNDEFTKGNNSQNKIIVFLIFTR